MSTYTEDKRKVTTRRLLEMKQRGEKISMLTAYDFSMAKLIDEAGMDVILVGDSASNVMAGNVTTLPMTLDQMIYHGKSVMRGVNRALVVVDMPFGTYQGNSKEALASAIRIMKETHADCVKLEGGAEVRESIERILCAGIPVMGHLGLTPQSINKFGSYTVRAREEAEANKLIEDAKLLQEIGCFAIVLEKKLDKVYEAISEENAELTTIAEENLAGVRTVKAFAREKFEISKFLSHNKRYYDLNMSEAKTMVKYDPVFNFMGVLLPIMCTVLGGISVMKGQMDIGSLAAYVEYSRNCTWPVEALGWLVNSISSAVASRKKIRKIFEQKSSIVEKAEPVVLDCVKGNIEFSNVSFDIGTTNILSDINFSVEQGKTLGIMGATGSGKSSVINLLERFYDTTEGTVKIDGVDVRDLSLSQIRENISVVMQDVFLFSDSIKENIKMGKRDVLELEGVKEAAKKTGLKSYRTVINTGKEAGQEVFPLHIHILAGNIKL